MVRSKWILRAAGIGALLIVLAALNEVLDPTPSDFIKPSIYKATVDFLFYSLLIVSTLILVFSNAPEKLEVWLSAKSPRFKDPNKLWYFLPFIIVSFIWNTYGAPEKVFGLNNRSTCAEYNTANIKYRALYSAEGCCYLNLEQSDALSRPGISEAIHNCFETKMNECRGWEKLSDIYRSCVKQITGMSLRQ